MVAARLRSCRPPQPRRLIWRWQERFRDEGAAGLWRDKTRRFAHSTLSPEVAKRVVALTLAGPPAPVTDRFGDGEGGRISVSSVRGYGVLMASNRTGCASSKLSNDPQFAAKLHEIVGLLCQSAQHAIVLSVDEEEPNSGA